MYKIKFMKKFLMPCGLCAAVPAVRPQPSQDPPEPCNCKKDTKMLRPSELPIYSLDDVCSKDIPCKNVEPPSALEQQIGEIRRSLQVVSSQWYVMSDTVSSKVNTGMEHSRNFIEYLQEEDNTMPRLGAVAIGGLTGLLFGLRGGILKKTIYLSTGAVTVGAICYPRKTQESFERAKYYANVGYNFVYGVKPGDDDKASPDTKMLDTPLLRFPTNFSELINLSVGIGTSIFNAANSIGEKTLELLNEMKEDSNPVQNKDSESTKKAD